MVSRIIAPWVKKVYTPEQLLGVAFLKGHEKSKFKTKEEWEEHKRQVTKMARFHSKMLRLVKEGKKEAKKIAEFPEVDIKKLKKKEDGN